MDKISLFEGIRKLERLLEKRKIGELERVITSINLSLAEIKKSSIRPKALLTLEEIYRNMDRIKDELDYRDKLIRSASLKSFFFNLGGWLSGIALTKLIPNLPYSPIYENAGIMGGIGLSGILYFLYYYPKFRACRSKVLDYSVELKDNLKRFVSEAGIKRRIRKTYPFVYI